ncbi:MAG: winged helix-turn-helix domain-containing protein [Sulfurihydrogenibium sp.]|jgi:molybdate transport repressor ModE-like protein|uniref:winged helix-turn-helix domain-containing protein n=1 Tax=Sulfurihydrogenibium sp. TaxID=2053621 RepID=UPI000CC7EEDC|nr:MAG: ModE family transcriptional regulator [Sulfurihydrogenibium sp.]PMP77424.1 MAG: ModE family transcriptional regulator [Sulfurihydrogenibium sp.]
MEIKYKVWVEKNGEILIGLGREELLREIEKTGSIRQAAENMGITYRKALYFLDAMEKRAGEKIVETFRGGPGGGGSRLTEYGKKLLKEFEKVVKEFEKAKERASKGLNLE